MIITSKTTKSKTALLEKKLNEFAESLSKINSCNYDLFLTATKMLEHIHDRQIKDKFIAELAEIKFERYK